MPENSTGELNKSYFKDFADVKSTGGKLWTAPDTVIQAKVSERLSVALADLVQRSLFFPELHGTALSDRSTKYTAEMLRGKVSLLVVLTSRLSVVRLYEKLW
jgi:hypothetical protein